MRHVSSQRTQRRVRHNSVPDAMIASPQPPPPPQTKGQGGRGRSKGGEKLMGTTAYGGKGSKGRAANGDRPVGAASCRRDHHTMASCQNPPPKPWRGRMLDPTPTPCTIRRPQLTGGIPPHNKTKQVCFTGTIHRSTFHLMDPPTPAPSAHASPHRPSSGDMGRQAAWAAHQHVCP